MAGLQKKADERWGKDRAKVKADGSKFRVNCQVAGCKEGDHDFAISIKGEAKPFDAHWLGHFGKNKDEKKRVDKKGTPWIQKIHAVIAGRRTSSQA